MCQQLMAHKNNSSPSLCPAKFDCVSLNENLGIFVIMLRECGRLMRHQERFNKRQRPRLRHRQLHLFGIGRRGPEDANCQTRIIPRDGREENGWKMEMEGGQRRKRTHLVMSSGCEANRNNQSGNFFWINFFFASWHEYNARLASAGEKKISNENAQIVVSFVPNAACRSVPGVSVARLHVNRM